MILLICPSSLLFTPYVQQYIEVLLEHSADYTIIVWDRLHTNVNTSDNIVNYVDSKDGHRRSAIDYLRYTKFVSQYFEKNKIDKVIIFSIQLLFFLNKYILRKYKKNYIIDVRDYHYLIGFFNIKKVMNYSAMNVISSDRYTTWLPYSENTAISHNILLSSSQSILYEDKLNNSKSVLSIAFIGAIRDLAINIKFIESLANSDVIQMFFIGKGHSNQILAEFVKTKSIRNVYIFGKYERNEEGNHYQQHQFINVMRYNNSVNNRTALPNRLYLSVIHGNHMIALKGTYLAEIIDAYHLGLTIDSFDNLETKILDYINKYDKVKFNYGRKTFIDKVAKDNKEFVCGLEKFINGA